MTKIKITSDDFAGYCELPELPYYTCPNCKTLAIEESDNFCSECGVEIEWDLIRFMK